MKIQFKEIRLGLIVLYVAGTLWATWAVARALPPQKQEGALDVPAVTKNSEVSGGVYGYPCRPACSAEMECDPISQKDNFECADESRFLLFSQNGKAHCLKLVPNAAGSEK